MFRNIVVALDGSENAEQALPVAAGIARRSHARLTLLHALDFLTPAYAHCQEADEYWCENAHDLAQRYLDSVAADVKERWHVTADTEVVEADAVKVLTTSAKVRKADLIVMTTHSRGPIRRFWLGSVTDQVLRESGVPVLLIPLGPASERAVDAPFTHVIAPVDGSVAAERALDLAAAFARSDGARLTLLQVSPPVLVHALPDADHLYEDTAAVAREYLAKRTRSLSTIVHRPQYTVLEGASPIAMQILDYAAQHKADLITLSTHGSAGLRRLILGSVADKVIRGSPVPILVVRIQRQPIPGEGT